MAFSKKNKRKIVVNNQDFYWWVTKGSELGRTLHLIGLNKKFHIVTGVDDTSYWVEHAVPSGTWDKPGRDDIKTNPFHNIPDDEITPKYIRILILWCLYPDQLQNELKEKK